MNTSTEVTIHSYVGECGDFPSKGHPVIKHEFKSSCCTKCECGEASDWLLQCLVPMCMALLTVILDKLTASLTVSFVCLLG